MEKEKVIQVKLPTDAVIEKLNAVVRTKVDFKDQWGETDYLFWGPKIENNEFVWINVRYGDGLHRTKGTIVDMGNGSTEIHIKVMNVIHPCFIYILCIWMLLIGIIAKQNFGIIFSFVFVVAYWMVKQNYLDRVTTDIENVFREFVIQ